MTTCTLVARLAVVGLLLAAPASSLAAPELPATAKPQRQCFWTQRITSFAAPDDHTVNLRVGARDVYQMELFAPCPEVNWRQTIAVQSRGGSYICSGLDAEIIAPSSIGPQRCAVRTVRKLTAAEVAGLPKRGRP